jgi:hypothetical protein
MKKIKIKGWPAIIAFGIVTWPFWLVYWVLLGAAWLLCYGILIPIDKLYNYIKRKHHESLSNRSRD